MTLQAVLMCGGLGTRLRPWSLIIPKPMFPIGERPMLELLLERLKIHGITDIYLSVGYKAEIIEGALRDGSHLGVSLHYIHENEPLGTAGALNLVKDKLTGPFLLMNGDILTRLDFQKFNAYHQACNAEITVGVKNYEVQIPYGVLEDNAGRVTNIREKPTYSNRINSGIYLVSPSVLDLMPAQGRFDATQLIQAAVDAKRAVFSYVIEEYWLDIGRLEDYYRANEDAKRWMEEDNKAEPDDAGGSDRGAGS